MTCFPMKLDCMLIRKCLKRDLMGFLITWAEKCGELRKMELERRVGFFSSKIKDISRKKITRESSDLVI